MMTIRSLGHGLENWSWAICFSAWVWNMLFRWSGIAKQVSCSSASKLVNRTYQFNTVLSR